MTESEQWSVQVTASVSLSFDSQNSILESDAHCDLERLALFWRKVTPVLFNDNYFLSKCLDPTVPSNRSVEGTVGFEARRQDYLQYRRKRSALGRINARVGCNSQLEHHYMRELETMQMRVALSLSVMLAMACTSTREGQPQRMRSLILLLAA